MISYFELLKLIQKGEEPELIQLLLNCGNKYYQPYYDGDEFNYYGLCEEVKDISDFRYYLGETLLESQMFNKCIKIVRGHNHDDLIPEHIPNEFIQQLKNEDSKCIAHKVNEIINYLHHIKGDNNE